jgi:hypothetical protein
MDLMADESRGNFEIVEGNRIYPEREEASEEK